MKRKHYFFVVCLFAVTVILLSACKSLDSSKKYTDSVPSVTLDVLNRGSDAFYGCDVNISIKEFIDLGFEFGDEFNVRNGLN